MKMAIIAGRMKLCHLNFRGIQAFQMFECSHGGKMKGREEEGYVLDTEFTPF